MVFSDYVNLVISLPNLFPHPPTLLSTPSFLLYIAFSLLLSQNIGAAYSGCIDHVIINSVRLPLLVPDPLPSNVSTCAPRYGKKSDYSLHLLLTSSFPCLPFPLHFFPLLLAHPIP